MKSTTTFWLSALVAAILLFCTTQSRAQLSTATITVNDTSKAPTGINATATTICNGQSSTLTVQGGELGTGAGWVWYAGGCGAGASVGTGNSITVSPTDTTTYYVRAEGGACNYTTACASQKINVNPTPTATAPANQVYCFGATTLALPISGTPSNVVFNISGGTSVGLGNQTGVTQVPSFTAANATTAPITATITITPTANGCTGNSVTYTITVLPQVSMTPVADIVACNGTPVNTISFSGTPSGAVYNWTNDQTSIGLGLGTSGTGNINGFTGVNSGCTDVVANLIVIPEFTASGKTCQGSADTFTITIHPSPNGTIAGSTICEGQQGQLTFNATCGTAPFSLDILSGGNTNTYNSIGSGTPFNVNPVPTATTTYDLMKITDANGCIRQ